MGNGKIVDELQAFLEKLVVADLFSGAVLIALNGIPIFKKAYGLANKSFNVPNQIDTKFNLGSMNKMFTAVAIAQLAERGKLAFSDLISKHLPDYPRTVGDKVTIHHLLTHTSGMGDFFNEKFFFSSKDQFKTVEAFLPLFQDDPLSFEPGAQWQYSNAGFIVLGAIIEQVVGQSYFDYVREHIYKSAVMPNTDAYELDQPIPNLAIGYTNMGDNFQPLLGSRRRSHLFMLPVKGCPAAGGYSTVSDLLNFDIALRQHKLLSYKYTNIVLSGKVAFSDEIFAKYAYGFVDERVNEFFDGRVKQKRITGHKGGIPGINAQLDMYLDDGYTVVVLSNYDPPAGQRVAAKLRELINYKQGTHPTMAKPGVSR